MERLGYEFQDPGLLELAFTHASVQGSSNNERLEFLGDAALDLVIAEELFHRHQDLPEGDLTELKSAIVSRKGLAQAARELRLGDRARVGGGMRDRELPASVLANLYEAVLGAVYLDGGYEAARSVARRTLHGALEVVEERRRHANPKQRLQELSQSRWSRLPTYDLVEQRGEAHARAFLVQARLGTQAFPSAWGRTRKEAERWAAHEALLVLRDERQRVRADDPDGARTTGRA